MKKIFLLFTILIVSVMTTACINNLAVQELNSKAVKYMDNGDSETAICRLKSSLDLDNEIYQTHYNLAVAYNNVGQYEEAIVELNKVLELKPDFYDAIYTLAVAKEAIAFKIFENDNEDEDTVKKYTKDEITEFNNKASEVIELYNQYLSKKVNAKESDVINARISDINSKIKQFSEEYATLEEESQKNNESGEVNE